jgi:hypothetical protein
LWRWLRDRNLGRVLLASDRALDGFDEILQLDEPGACAFRSIAIKRSGENLCERIAVFDHALARLYQSGQSFVHDVIQMCAVMADNTLASRLHHRAAWAEKSARSVHSTICASGDERPSDKCTEQRNRLLMEKILLAIRR